MAADTEALAPQILDASTSPVRHALAALDPNATAAPSASASTTAITTTPTPPDPALFAAPEVVEALTALFDGTCGYCESPLVAPSARNVDHYRPPSRAQGSDGVPSPRHYWWLAYTWTNLVLACTDCIKHKGSRFPVEGIRAEPDGDLAAEQALVIDPRARLASPDSLDSLLVHQPDGTVASTDARGIATIEALALNRGTLVAARASIWRQGPDASLSPAAHRTLRHQRDALTSADRLETKASFDITQWLKNQAPIVGAAAPHDTAATSAASVASYYSATRWMERIELHNVRPIRHLTLDLTASAGVTAPWEVLLGDNASGKSSILTAVALTLIGAEYRRALGIDPATILRRGCRSGFVKIWMTGLTDPVVLTFERGSSEFGGSTDPQVVVLGYGAMRLRGRSHAERLSSVSHVDNLFDPRHELVDPTTWLSSLDDAQFAQVSASLRLLLALDASTVLERSARGDRIWIRFGKSREPLDQLSDGYQSMLVLACDVLNTAFSMWSAPDQAEGVVIIDELGTHLHPRWRMRIVTALRTVLPRMQVLASTHDPLCLRGLYDGEVSVIVRNTAGEVSSISDLPPVQGLRVEQLLTSEHFGLGSTDDPHVDELFEEYYALRALPSRSAAEADRLAAIDAELTDLRQLGTTERERLVLQAADQFLAERRSTGDQVVLRDEVKGELRGLWEAALPKAGS